MQVNAGHGIELQEHRAHPPSSMLERAQHRPREIVSRAMWVGLENAVKEMLTAMANYPRMRATRFVGRLCQTPAPGVSENERQREGADDVDEQLVRVSESNALTVPVK